MRQWLEFEARSRGWLRAVAQASAWVAPFVVLTRQRALDELSPSAARAPAVAAVLGLLLIVVLWVMVRRGGVLRRSLYLPALLPVLIGCGFALGMGAPALGETFGSQFDALQAHDQLRRGLVVDGFRGGLLLLSVALTMLPWLGDQPAESRALPIAFGLRIAVPVLAIGVMVAWAKVDGVGQASVLLPVLLGIVALAEIPSAPGRDSALVLGVALSAALLGALAVPIDDGSLSAEAVAGARKGLLRYLPALLLAFGLVFSRRVDRQNTLRSLLVALAPTLLAFTLGFGFVDRAREWLRAPSFHWLRTLPEGFQLVQGREEVLDEERVARVLLVGERSLTRGGQELGPTTELDAAPSCDRLVQRLALTPGEPLVFAADRRVPLARLDCLLAAVTRSARARRAMLDAKAVKVLCTAREIRFAEDKVGLIPIKLYAEGCTGEIRGLTVRGPDWQSSTAADLTLEGSREFACPPLNTAAPGRIGAMPVGLTRRVPDVQGHEMFACGYAPRVPHEASPPAPASKPPGPFERLLIGGEILSKQPDETANTAFNDALRRCYADPTVWPQQTVWASLAVSSADRERPEIWHVSSGVEHDAAARCVRGWASEFSAKLPSAAERAVRPVLFEYSLRPEKLVITLSTNGVAGKPWSPQEVEDRLPAIKACYEPALRAKPELMGILNFTLSLNSRHLILSANSTHPPAMARIAYCIAPLLQGLDTSPPSWMGDPRSASFNVEMQWAQD